MRQARRQHVFLLRSSRMPEIARWEARGSGRRGRLKIHPDCLQLSMRDRPLWLSLLKRCFFVLLLYPLYVSLPGSDNSVATPLVGVLSSYPVGMYRQYKRDTHKGRRYWRNCNPMIANSYTCAEEQISWCMWRGCLFHQRRKIEE